MKNMALLVSLTVSLYICQTAQPMEIVQPRWAGWLWERPFFGPFKLVTGKAQRALVLRAVIQKLLVCVSQLDNLSPNLLFQAGRCLLWKCLF